MKGRILSQLNKLEALRGNPVIVFHAMLADDSVYVLYEWFRKYGRIDRLDLVLVTSGGAVTVARRIALLLREYVEHLTILVPHKARSAGTLLCLSADELLLGPMAELGPIDSHIGSANPIPPDAPSLISAEDIRAFRYMAEDWFGITREEDRLQVLALIAQRIFPTSLSSFYRFDKLVRQIATELLAYQLNDVEDDVRKKIIDQLVEGYYAHDYVFSRTEMRELGLRVRCASVEEETLLWDLRQACRAQIIQHPTEAEGEVIGLIIGTGFRAQEVVRRAGSLTHYHDGPQQEDASPQRSKPRPRWHRILQRGVPQRDNVGGKAQPQERMDVRWEIDA